MDPIQIESQIGVLLNEAEAALATAQSRLYAAVGLATPEFLANYDEQAANKGMDGITKGIKAVVIAKDRVATGHKLVDKAMATYKGIRTRGGGK